MTAARVLDVDSTNLGAALAFLEQHVETSLFLLSNLSSYGPRAIEHLNSGNFKCVEADGEIQAVFCLARRGNLLAETGGRTDLSQLILEACDSEPMPITGVIGEWRAAEALWQLVLSQGGIIEKLCSREGLYSRELAPGDAPASDPRVRQLIPADYERWSLLQRAFLAEQGIPTQSTSAQGRALFEESARALRWWGASVDGELRATVALNALYEKTGQVGGVYTEPDYRKRGLARVLMKTLFAESRAIHGLERLTLFTGEQNQPAIALYLSLGFVPIGEFALLFGSR